MVVVVVVVVVVGQAGRDSTKASGLTTEPGCWMGRGLEVVVVGVVGGGVVGANGFKLSNTPNVSLNLKPCDCLGVVPGRSR